MLRKTELLREISRFPYPAFEILKGALDRRSLINVSEHSLDRRVFWADSEISFAGVDDFSILGSVYFLHANSFIDLVYQRSISVYAISEKGAALLFDIDRFKINVPLKRPSD